MVLVKSQRSWLLNCSEDEDRQEQPLPSKEIPGLLMREGSVERIVENHDP